VTSRDSIRFLRRGKIVELRDVPPMRTVLDYLRLEERSRGTKEGCNEGDCGACTVAIGSLRDGRLVYEPVNACILLLGQLDGKELVSVDDLSTDGHLHPVQQALVDTHGSQCGFCTPGFVMSLFTLYQKGVQPDAGGDRNPHRRQSLPLHRLSPHHRCGAGILQRAGDGPVGQGSRRRHSAAQGAG
jgi:xanthine dehydrogenase small subunit